ncbi:tetratricopeptide repeat protein [Arcicella aquatica]|uniref:Tetratricopeptide repeat protein n=1 Tax=Arcicella aquatica TaxID=217141 RepID=A0ABU5QUK8_9BACT|nr:tetratricopeptide repeat protein [Arcicella aquatica]MEA5260791.1 tetratricopeptide repeat protein [Arcicella aquatica]
MRKLYSLLVLLFCSNLLAAQKIDLDKYPIKVSYLQLPTNPFPEDFTTFSTKFIANGINLNDAGYTNRESDLESIYFKISGFKRVATGGHLSIKVQIDGYDMGKLEVVKKEDKSKDKDGKETISISYKLTFKYLVPMKYTITDLNGVIVKDGSLTEGASAKTYESSSYSTSTALENYWKENGTTIKRGLLGSFISEKLSTFEGRLNYEIGYVPRTYNDVLWSTDSPKHPENEQFKKVCSDVKTAMDEMTSARPLSLEKVKPAIEYFEGILVKYAKDEKPERKLRYAAWFNMATIYYWLEDFDNAIRCCDGLVANDYDKSDAKDIKLNSERMKKILSGSIKSAHYVRDVTNAVAPPLTPFQVEEENTRLGALRDKAIQEQATRDVAVSQQAVARSGMVDLDKTVNAIGGIIGKIGSKKTAIVFDKPLADLIISMNESLVNYQLISKSLSINGCSINSSLFMKTQVESFQKQFNSVGGSLDKQSSNKMKSLLNVYGDLTSKDVMAALMITSNPVKMQSLLVEPNKILKDMTYDCLDLVLNKNQDKKNILMSLAEVQKMLNYGTYGFFKEENCNNQAYELAKEGFSKLKAVAGSSKLSEELIGDFNQLISVYSPLFQSDKNLIKEPTNTALVESINKNNYPSFVLKLLQTQ